MRRQPRDYGETTRARRAMSSPLSSKATVAGAGGDGASVGDSSSGSCVSAVMWTFLLTGVGATLFGLWLADRGIVMADRERARDEHAGRELRARAEQRAHEHARVTEA